MIALKDYQLRVLDSLREFLRRCSQTGDANTAFREVTRENFGEPIPYQHVEVAGLSKLPYVCLRVPTGGGKTLLACHAAGLAMKELLHAERAVVLWLVPSNTILDQTADALRDPRHPYRRALELECGAVEVVTIAEALRLTRASVEGQTVVIVSTIQCFRVDDETGRKVYEQNGSFAEHFLSVPADRLGELEPGADGRTIMTLRDLHCSALQSSRLFAGCDDFRGARRSRRFSVERPERVEQTWALRRYLSRSDLKVALLRLRPSRAVLSAAKSDAYHPNISQGNCGIRSFHGRDGPLGRPRRVQRRNSASSCGAHFHGA